MRLATPGACHIIILDDQSLKLLCPTNSAAQYNHYNLGPLFIGPGKRLESNRLKPAGRPAAGSRFFAEPWGGPGFRAYMEYPVHYSGRCPVAAPNMDSLPHSGPSSDSRHLPVGVGADFCSFRRFPQRLACHWVTIYTGPAIFRLGASSAVCTLVLRELIKEHLW